MRLTSILYFTLMVLCLSLITACEYEQLTPAQTALQRAQKNERERKEALPFCSIPCQNDGGVWHLHSDGTCHCGNGTYVEPVIED